METVTEWINSLWLIERNKTKNEVPQPIEKKTRRKITVYFSVELLDHYKEIHPVERTDLSGECYLMILIRA